MTDLLQAHQVPPAPPPPAPASPRQAFARLVIVVIAGVLAAVVTHTTDLLLVVVAIIVMVMLHELGHFATAKWSHMKVTEYFFGFGPRLWSVRRGETEYGVKALPLGGYVKIVGMSNLEEVDPADEPRTYRQQPFHNRLLVAVAGSTVHFLIALVLIYALILSYGLPNSKAVEVAAMSHWDGRSTPAQVAGIRPGDLIVAVDGKAITSETQLQHAIGGAAGRRVTVELRHDGRDFTRTLVPANGEKVSEGGVTADPKGTHDPGLIGVQIENPTVSVNPLVAAGDSVAGTSGLLSRMGSIFAGIGHLFSPSFLSSYFHDVTNSQAAAQAAKTGNRPLSIVGAARLATQGAQSGPYDFLSVLILLNIFFGILNLFPMLPLDGGHVVIAVYERIRSRRGRLYHADVRKLAPAAYALMGVVGVLFVTSLYLDVTHPIVNPFK